jgi:hypothetical protein
MSVIATIGGRAADHREHGCLAGLVLASGVSRLVSSPAAPVVGSPGDHAELDSV